MYLKKNRFLIFTYLLCIAYAVLLGCVYLTNINDITENALLKLGQVTYPVKTPQFYFQERLHSLFYLIAQVLLKLNSSIDFSLVFFSSLLPAISFSSIIYILNKKAFQPLSFFVIVIISYCSIYNIGLNYDISLLSSISPQGHLGLVTIAIIFHLFHSRYCHFSFLLMGLAPLFHLTLGFWANFSILFFVLEKHVFKKNIEVEDKLIKKYFCYFIGFLFTVLFYLFTLPPVTYPVSGVDTSHFISYLKNWDMHQVGYHLFEPGLFLALVYTLIVFLKDGLSVKLKTIIFLLVISIFHGFCANPLELYLPRQWWMLMPSRIPNFLIVFIPVFILRDLLNESKPHLVSIILFCLSISSLLIGLEGYWLKFSFSICFSAIIVINHFDLSSKFRFIWTRKLLSALLCGGGIIILALQALSFNNAKIMSHKRTQNFQNDSLYKYIHNESYFLLTAPSVKHMQLRVGRPVAIELDTIDDLIYNPYLIKETASVVSDLYGINFLQPYRQFRNQISLLDDHVKAKWERWDTDKWGEIYKKYKISHVIVPKSWILDLTVVTRTDKYYIYLLPKVK